MDDVPEDVFEETLEEVFEEVVPDELTELFEVFEELSEPFDDDEPPEASELSEPLDLELFDDFVEEPDFDEDELLCELRSCLSLNQSSFYRSRRSRRTKPSTL